MGASKPVFSLRRLRAALVVAAVLLLLTVAGFVGYARYRAGRFLAGLPGRLGVNITQETDHFTYSQTWKGRTVLTVRAAKQVQRANGKVTLEDASIVLYGRSGNRADRIHGQQFEYDQKNGVISALGDVFIDLAPPGAGAAHGGDAADAGAKAKPVEDESRMIHLKTSGLVYRQKEQVASTEKALEFRAAGMTGTAVGAVYDAEKGTLTLGSAVRVSGLRGSRASEAAGNAQSMVLTAGHAELDREGNTAMLDGAKLVSAGEGGTEVASAQHAVVHMTADGVLERVDANGSVTLTGDGRGTVTAERLELGLNAKGQPSAAHLAGVVRFTNELDGRHEYAKANDARIGFDAEGRPTRALIAGNVEADVSQGAGDRWLGADTVDLVLAGGGKVPVVVRVAVAKSRDGARLRMVDAVMRKDASGKTGAAIERTNVQASVLTGRFVANSRLTVVSGVDGVGRTVVERSLTDMAAATGAPPLWRDTGTGETMKLDFKQTPLPGAAKHGEKTRTDLARAEQRGSVKIVRETVTKAAAGTKSGVDVDRADADDAVFDAESDRALLSGGVKLADAESALFADRVSLDRATGDATAEGAVRVSYLQQGSTGEPVHVLAGHAVANKAAGVTHFFGAGAGGVSGGNVRMWQAGSQIEAPALDFNRRDKTLLAHGLLGADTHVVKTTLVNANLKPGAAGKQSSAPVRVLSRELLYTDATRQIDFRGAVEVNDRDGVLKAQQAVVYLAPKEAAGLAQVGGAAISLGGRVERIVATGGVEIEQPGRKAAGDRLVYTAADGLFVLTGTKVAPPRLTDQAQGSVTGAELRFHTGDDSVEVLGGDAQQRVHTETRLKQKE
jgi:lipopolysaccharide export system protein LptA